MPKKISQEPLSTSPTRDSRVLGNVAGVTSQLRAEDILRAGGGRVSSLLNNNFVYRPRGSGTFTHVAGASLRPLPGWGVTCRDNTGVGGAEVSFTDIGKERRALRVTRPTGMANANQWIVFQALSLRRSAYWAGRTPRMALEFRRGAAFDGVLRLGAAYMTDGVERVCTNQGYLHVSDVDLTNAVLGAGSYAAGSWHLIDHLFTQAFAANATQVLFYVFWIPTSNPAAADSWFEIGAIDVVDAADYPVAAPSIPLMGLDEEALRCAELLQVFDLPCAASPATKEYGVWPRMLRTPAIEAQPGETLPAGFTATGTTRQTLVLSATGAGTVKGIASAEL